MGTATNSMTHNNVKVANSLIQDHRKVTNRLMQNHWNSNQQPDLK
jgi:hypothetical protein